jgi:glycine C-acetyltransferase
MRTAAMRCGGTLGEALGGASGGFTTGRREIVDLLRQRSRPYLFSNTLAPMIAAASLEALQVVDDSPELLERLRRNMSHFRSAIEEAGFETRGAGPR